MDKKLEKKEKAYKLLKEYNGDNSYIIYLRNGVYAYKNLSLNDFQLDFIINNYDKSPRQINKTVKVAQWWGEKQKEKWQTDFVPEKVYITWFLGEAADMYVFYCIYRRSQEKAVMCFAPKNAIITDFLSEDYNSLPLDLEPYNKRSGRTLMPYQVEAVKFLVSRRKAILASAMGSGKTFAAIIAALEDKYKHILIIAPASVKKTWEKELKLVVDEDDITIVEGSKWKDAKFTIINYDILDKFYEIPTETVKKKELNVDDKGNVVVETKEKEVVSRKSAVIEDAMANSQLFQANFDLVIIDEAHRLSNTSSGRYKIVADLLKRSNPRGIYALTGTPITNRPINFFNILKIIGSPLANDWQYYVKRYCDGKTFFKKNERDAHTAIFLRQKHKSSWYDLTYFEKQELDEYLEKRCHRIWVTNGASNLDELQERVKPYYLRRMKEDFGHMVKKNIEVLHYKLTKTQKQEYDAVWDEYEKEKSEEKSQESIEKHRKMTEGTLLKQWLAVNMVPKTIKFIKKCLKKGEKVVVFTTYDEELYTLQAEFKDICVIHNGKLTAKKKEEAVEKFQNDPETMVFIGNLYSAGVGLTLTAAHIVVFNSISFVPGDNQQAEDRIHRLNQTEDCTVYYQVFDETYMEHIMETVHGKDEIINNIILSENEK